MSDAELDQCIARTAGGDAAALHELYDALGSAVFSLARAVTGDRQLAEDVLQDVFLKVHAGARAYRKRGSPRAWVMRIARNEAISAYRRRRREFPAEIMEEADAQAVSPDAADAIALNDALAELSNTDREIVVLGVVAGLTDRETAALLGMPQGSVSWRRRAALEKLRSTLAGNL